MSDISSDTNVEATEQAEPMELEEQQSSTENNGIRCNSNIANKKSLLQLVRNKYISTKDICEDWIKLYELDSISAIIKLMDFVLEASGTQYKVPNDVKLPFDYLDILITATAQYGSKGYPLMLKSGHSFAEDICSFIEQLLRLLAATSIISDDCFLKTISDFLMVCSDSKVRPFRHTTTLIALKFMTFLNGMVLRNQKNIKEIWLQMFAKVFLERFTDVVEEIRRLSTAECGLWLDQYPVSFMEPNQVEFLYQALQDNSMMVCEASLQSLLKLCSKLKLQIVCLLQGKNYRMTLLGLTMSAESELAEMAIQLLIKYYGLDPQILDKSMVNVIEELVFAAHRGIAQAAAEIIPLSRFQSETSDKERILVLVRFYIECSKQEHAAYFVDAFYGRNDIILNWRFMVLMLLKPKSLSPQETSALIEIMTRSVKQAVTGEVPVGRYMKDLVRQPKANAKKRAAHIFLPNLCALLRQYCTSTDDLVNLLELPQHIFEFPAEFLEVVVLIKDIMLKHENMSVLQMGAMTLEHICGISERSANQCKELFNSAVNNYNIAITELSTDNPKRLIITLRLLSALYARFDLHDWQLINDLKNALSEQGSIPDEALALRVSIFYVSLSWDLKRVRDLAQAGKDVDEECHALRNRLKDFLTINFKIIKHTSVDSNFACDAFVYTCDLFVLFADSLRKSSCRSIQALEHKSQRSDYELLEDFLNRYVFIEGAELTNWSFADRQSKRRILTSYLKLAFHNLMPMMRACVVFQYYEQYHFHFGDIIRSTMERCLATNATNFGMTVMHTCLMAYMCVRDKFPDFSQAVASTEFEKLLKLAKLLAELFHINPLEVREGILILHRAGINFATGSTPKDSNAAPKDLMYLKVIQQFVPQLLTQDVLDILNFLQIINQDPLPSHAEEWQPMLSYRRSLEIALRRTRPGSEIGNFLVQ